jgi:hypothetical protein
MRKFLAEKFAEFIDAIGKVVDGVVVAVMVVLV